MAKKKKQPLKVVLIDDNLKFLSSLTKVLQRKGYSVETYESALKSPFMDGKGCCPCPVDDPRCPDVIVVDIDMPGMNGVEFLDVLHRRECRCKHFALMTGYHMKESHLARITKLGGQLFQKPFTMTNVADWLSRYCEKKDAP